MPKPKEKRVAVRKPFRHIGWIATPEDGVLLKCMVSDISETGARLDAADPEGLPDEFTLLLTRDAKMRRKCQVVWREGMQVGVHFDRRHR